MRKTLIFAMLLVGYTNYAQTDAEYEVKYVIDYFFDGFHQSDSLKMKSVMHKDMTMQSLQKNKEGVDVLVETNTDQFVSLVTAIC